ncbi:protein translocase subunit SecF [Rugosimonospora acidiphila]|uniref:Protein-export membrane protein SecF n=1 Tax=Rugosimonospora acidiphila TaxID=556531 RepID=A0ABP9RXQ6_9ACTN
MATRTQAGGFRKLYRGETRVDFIGQRKKWYLVSAVIILICLLSIIFRGFNWGIDFKGGDQFQIPVKPGTTLSQVQSAVEGTGVTVSSAQTAGAGKAQSYVIKTQKLTDPQRNAAEAALAKAANVDESQVNNNEVSSSWGSEVTNKAIIALIVFLAAVSLFMGFRFRDAKASGAAVLALFHDLVLTAGVYSLVHFEVTPGTVVGLLTILGYSLYDTVVVFDKVDENTRGILGTSRHTFGEAANLAVNQTLMRSINTSLIGLLPVAGLLFIGAGILGVGTLEDLALVLFVGMLTGAYSSLFLATPWLVDFKLFDLRYRNHTNRVLNKRAADARAAANKAAAAAVPSGRSKGAKAAAESGDVTDTEDASVPADAALATAAAPRTATKAAAGKRPAGTRPGGGGRSNRAGGKRRH